MVLPALSRGGYVYQTQVNIGTRFGGGKHLIDILAEGAGDQQFLISMKWQQVSGTAEQKVLFEAMCLAEAVRTSTDYTRAYLVLGGEGWKLRDFFVKGGLREHLTYGDLVVITTLEAFVALANRGRL